MVQTIKKIGISSSALKNLRESSGYSISEVAKKLKSSSEKIESVESGKSSFTITQIKRLADVYQRPIVAFFSDTIGEIPAIPDYRINREKKLTPTVFLAKRRAYYLTNKLTELSEQKSQIPYFPDNLKADELAQHFRIFLNSPLLKNKKSDALLEYYKKALEAKLLISIIEFPLKADDVRAFCISSEISIIVLNEQDKPEIKLFSLFHEVCHLLKKNSGICSMDIEQKNNQEIEYYCNLFAAEFLAPLEDLKKEVVGVPEQEEIGNISKTYGLSKQVVMLRLLALGKINIDRYNSFKGKFNEQELKKIKFGRRKWEKVFLNRVGNFAIQEVNKAYRGGKVSSSDVIDILNVKTKYLDKFIEK